MLKKNSNTIVIDFFVDLASENASKINNVSNIFPKCWFCKNRAPVQAEVQCLKFEPLKNDQKLMLTLRSKQKLENKVPEISGSILAYQKPPENIPNTWTNRSCLKGSCTTTYGTRFGGYVSSTLSSPRQLFWTDRSISIPALRGWYEQGERAGICAARRNSDHLIPVNILRMLCLGPYVVAT